jgi:hypothetical protein
MELSFHSTRKAFPGEVRNYEQAKKTQDEVSILIGYVSGEKRSAVDK